MVGDCKKASVHITFHKPYHPNSGAPPRLQSRLALLANQLHPPANQPGKDCGSRQDKTERKGTACARPAMWASGAVGALVLAATLRGAAAQDPATCTMPDPLWTNNVVAVIEHIGEQFTHTGGYKDKMRLGMAAHNVGASTRLGAKLHYYTERLQSAMMEPYSNVNRAYGKIPIREDLQDFKRFKTDDSKRLIEERRRTVRRMVTPGIKDRLNRPIDRGR
eukprot:SAG22_NODE_1015_length_6025_cov_3.431320_7_plen_220_part_00